MSGDSGDSGTAGVTKINEQLGVTGLDRTEYMRTWRAKNAVQQMVYYARRRAEATGIAFDLDPAKITIPTHCPCLGIPLIVGGANGRRGPTPNSPTLDRLDPTGPYSLSNTVVISFKANRAKQDLTPDELRMLADFFNHAAYH